MNTETKTVIFKDYTAFLNRENKKINGVSEGFAKENPTWEADNETNEACWNCRSCSDCSYCSSCRDCSYCSDCSDCSYCSSCRDCSYCSYCSDCSDCSDCSYCRYCRDCSDCSSCSDCTGKKEDKGTEEGKSVFPETPVIENIHQKVFEACSQEGVFDMTDWHKQTSCGTTHCRAGMVIHIAGEAGYALEAAYKSTLHAANMIYKKSSPDIRVGMPEYFVSNEAALVNMKECAEKEIAAKTV